MEKYDCICYILLIIHSSILKMAVEISVKK